MDGGEWSPFSHEKNKVFLSLSSGGHTFEVRARDRDFNIDPTPAVMRFTVVPPVWRQPWFIGLVLAFVGTTTFQASRIVASNRKLKQSNTALSSANKDLFSVNRDLQQTLKEKEEAQQQLIQAERMAAVGELVAGSAHELNNPMAVASSMMQSIGEVLKEDTPEELVQDRAMLLQNVQVGLRDLNRAKDIVSSLLSLSDRTRSYAEAVQINIVADDALRVLKGRYDETKIRIVKEYGEDLPTVTGSFADLGQMAMHLVRNAVEAINGEGTVTLRTSLEDGRVVFECQDTGAGIPPEIRGEIFKPFFKTKPPAEGTGLGLYICREVVEKHSGTINVESEVGKGTTFRVRLPVK
jgi:two-component system NtrC family sensor kinase